MQPNDLSPEALADELLREWYDWSSGYRPDLDVPGCAPACRESRSSRQWDSTTEITRDVCHRVEMEAVEYCYDAIGLAFQNAISIEMKNRQVRVKVWQSTMGKTYREALIEIIPHMKKKNLL